MATALRTARVSLEYRMLRAFLVACKDQIKKRNNMSSKELAELAESLHGLIARQLGPVEEKSSAIIVEERKSAVVVEERSSTVIHVVTDVQPTSTTDGVSEVRRFFLGRCVSFYKTSDSILIAQLHKRLPCRPFQGRLS